MYHIYYNYNSIYYTLPLVMQVPHNYRILLIPCIPCAIVLIHSMYTYTYIARIYFGISGALIHDVVHVGMQSSSQPLLL